MPRAPVLSLARRIAKMKEGHHFGLIASALPVRTSTGYQCLGRLKEDSLQRLISIPPGFSTIHVVRNMSRVSTVCGRNIKVLLGSTPTLPSDLLMIFKAVDMEAIPIGARGTICTTARSRTSPANRLRSNAVLHAIPRALENHANQAGKECVRAHVRLFLNDF